MSISIIFIHVNNSSIILICNEKTGILDSGELEN
jgi:hypothetical protein